MLEQLFQAIDSQDSEAFTHFLAPDGVFRFGNLPAVRGHTNVQQFVEGFFSSIKSLAHTLDASWDVDGTTVCHGQVTYTRHDESTLTVPFANILKTGPAGITEYLIFADTSQLYQP